MNWMAKLYETYENVTKLDSPPTDIKNLAPICHILQNAHIAITVDSDGNFRGADVLEKRTRITLPVTTKSAGRTGKDPSPHPLADKLQYIAKDYTKYVDSKASRFGSYEECLHGWCKSEFAHPKAIAVYNYILKGCVLEDLIQSKILCLDDNGKLLEKWKQNDKEKPKVFEALVNLNQTDALVCWKVEMVGDPSVNTWEDEGLRKNWIEFCKSIDRKKGFCYITSKSDVVLAEIHPKGVRRSGDQAKLISFNDGKCFTYRGKFLDSDQACGISSEVTQKAHNALRWLIDRRQGYRNGDQAIITWAVSGKDIPNPFEGSNKFWEDTSLDEICIGNVDENVDESIIIDHSANIGQQFALKLQKKMAGYHAKLDNYERIIVMGLDSATPGRISITFYRESNAKEFFERIESWHTAFIWPQLCIRPVNPASDKKAKPKASWAISSPSPSSIAQAAYGENVKDNLKKKTIERKTIERLLPCIVDGAQFPRDLVDACVRRASNPNAYEKDNKWLWRKNIGIACAIYKGYYSDRNPNINERRNYQMSLEKERNTRDYLYGRLLAVADNIEEYALSITNTKRPTNAERLMQRFASRPFSTWKNIDESLRPYKNRLKVSKGGLLHYWEKEIQQICGLFKHEDFLNDSPLNGEYLLGYYCQKAYRKDKDDKGASITPEEIARDEIN